MDFLKHFEAIKDNISKNEQTLSDIRERYDREVADIKHQYDEQLLAFRKKFDQQFSAVEKMRDTEKEPLKEQMTNLLQEKKALVEDLILAQIEDRGDQTRRLPERRTGKCIDVYELPFTLVRAMVIPNSNKVNKFTLLVERYGGRAKVFEDGGRVYTGVYPTEALAEQAYRDKVGPKIRAQMEHHYNELLKRAKTFVERFGKKALEGFDFRFAFLEQYAFEKVVRKTKHTFVIDKGGARITLKYLGGTQFEMRIKGQYKPDRFHECIEKETENRIRYAKAFWIDDPEVTIIQE